MFLELTLSSGGRFAIRSELWPFVYLDTQMTRDRTLKIRMAVLHPH